MESAVKLCLEKWEALRLALYIHNTQMPSALPNGLMRLLETPSTSLETIQYYLEDYLDEKFSFDIEDDSAYDIASILLSVREECKQNRTDTLEKLKNIEKKPLQNIPDDSSSEEELEEEMANMEIEEVPELVPDVPDVPDVDEDGFQAVKPRRRKK